MENQLLIPDNNQNAALAKQSSEERDVSSGVTKETTLDEPLAVATATPPNIVRQDVDDNTTTCFSSRPTTLVVKSAPRRQSLRSAKTIASKSQGEARYRRRAPQGAFCLRRESHALRFLLFEDEDIVNGVREAADERA
ncbi:hypothetical protein V6N11_018545 [Hibiscus sabdariffa]|uniref:Uncharacterized protein n=1 Tax=Hibiscus sabdariffa TaxID=183260 RepID=A0ABR2T8C4_9ROSI